jgi:hypothetical protein
MKLVNHSRIHLYWIRAGLLLGLLLLLISGQVAAADWLIENSTGPTLPADSPAITLTPSPTPIPPAEPAGCWRPPDDYTHVWVGNAEFNARTLAMLDHAETLYHARGGFVAFRPAVTQGSYNPGGVDASFGTHDGGGAVDLSVRSRINWEVLTDEIGPMLNALRTAGFAAWLRESDELYPGSPIHIHAIAVGDRELSPVARDQIDGPAGYLRGFDGLPVTGAVVPGRDRYGGPVICNWMRDLGYDDWRALPGGALTYNDDGTLWS